MVCSRCILGNEFLETKRYYLAAVVRNFPKRVLAKRSESLPTFPGDAKWCRHFEREFGSSSECEPQSHHMSL